MSVTTTWRNKVFSDGFSSLSKQSQDFLGLWYFELTPSLRQIERRDPIDGTTAVSRLDSFGEIVGVFLTLPNHEDDLIYDRDSGFGNGQLATELTDKTLAELERAMAENKSCERTEFEWRDAWLTATIQVSLDRNYFAGYDHIELRVLEPELHAIPLTETGYKSHFCSNGHFEDLEEVLMVVKAQLEEKSGEQKWRDLVRSSAQQDLFR